MTISVSYTGYDLEQAATLKQSVPDTISKQIRPLCALIHSQANTLTKVQNNVMSVMTRKAKKKLPPKTRKNFSPNQNANKSSVQTKQRNSIQPPLFFLKQCPYALRDILLFPGRTFIVVHGPQPFFCCNKILLCLPFFLLIIRKQLILLLRIFK